MGLVLARSARLHLRASSAADGRKPAKPADCLVLSRDDPNPQAASGSAVNSGSTTTDPTRLDLWVSDEPLLSGSQRLRSRDSCELEQSRCIDPAEMGNFLTDTLANCSQFSSTAVQFHTRTKSDLVIPSSSIWCDELRIGSHDWPAAAQSAHGYPSSSDRYKSDRANRASCETMRLYAQRESYFSLK